MMLIDDPKKQITEAYRVLKPGSKACFTVWGRRENTIVFTIVEQAKKNLIAKGELPAEEEKKEASNFDLSENIEEYSAFMKETGFNEVKYWYQPMHVNYRTGEEFVKGWGGAKAAPEVLKPEIVRLYDELSGSGSETLRTFECMVILAYKD